MGDHDHGDSRRREVPHHFQNLPDQLRVERRGRLVKINDLRIVGKRSGDRDALLLPTGEL